MTIKISSNAFWKPAIFFLLCLTAKQVLAQNYNYSTRNAHSHNDYEQNFPFWLAYNEGFGSIEADIFLAGDSLLVAHDKKELDAHRNLENLYLDPLRSVLAKNNGLPYPDTSIVLTLLIDVKTDSLRTLDKLVQTLRNYPDITGSRNVQFAISGNRPPPDRFSSYPSFIGFDGVLSRKYDKPALSKIVLMSDDIHHYSSWNGKGVLPAKEWAALQTAVAGAHALNKPVRLWATPDFTNAWYQLMKLQVDYVNTDHISELSSFLGNLKKSSFTSTKPSYRVYSPAYKADNADKPAKNVILLIGDGCGLAQLYAGYTANHGQLNIFNMRNTGLSKTSSYDSYITDSAPGATAISSGEKTNNRSVGVDHTGAALPLLPALLSNRKIKTGLVTSGDIADATPADFYAHQPERGEAQAILRDLEKEPIDILMGSGDESLNNVSILDKGDSSAITGNSMKNLRSKFDVVSSIDSVKRSGEHGGKWIVVDPHAGLSMQKGRGDWLQRALGKTISALAPGKRGFFIMTEGAQIDYGGHANDMSYVVEEVLDFDKVVGDALKFADEDGETLVIVTADHETGGLTLQDGDYKKGYVSGHFSTNDHTASPVPVFAYGPRSHLFTGVYENTELFSKILAAYGIIYRK